MPTLELRADGWFESRSGVDENGTVFPTLLQEKQTLRVGLERIQRKGDISESEIQRELSHIGMKLPIIGSPYLHDGEIVIVNSHAVKINGVFRTGQEPVAKVVPVPARK